MKSFSLRLSSKLRQHVARPLRPSRWGGVRAWPAMEAELPVKTTRKYDGITSTEHVFQSPAYLAITRKATRGRLKASFYATKSALFCFK